MKPTSTALSSSSTAAAQGALEASLRRRGLYLWIPLLVVAFVLPLTLSDFRLTQVTSAAVYAVALLGLILLTGFGGQVSLGHGAIFALGAYGAAISITTFGVPFWLAPIIGAIACLVIGYLFGRPALRLPGHHLALATFGLAMAVPQLLRYKGFDTWTGGFQGLNLTPPELPLSNWISPDQWMYVSVLVVLAMAYRLLSNLLNGRMGRAIVAVRDHPIAATAMGIDTASVKTMTFSISAMCTGLAGGLSAITVLYVSADSFGAMLSITFLVGAVIGGMTTLSGALMGALVIQYLPLLTEKASQSASMAIYGVCVILAMYLMSQGMAGSLRKMMHKWMHR